VKETADSDDPLSRTRTGILFPQRSTQPILAGVIIPIDFLAPYDLILIIFLFVISLFLSGIRAAYAASGAMENPWERKSDAENSFPAAFSNLRFRWYSAPLHYLHWFSRRDWPGYIYKLIKVKSLPG
jgi:putative hemolysin